MDVVTTTRMLHLAQVMQQLPAEHGQIPLAQLEQSRDALQSIEAIPTAAPEPLLVSPPEHIDVRA